MMVPYVESVVVADAVSDSESSDMGSPSEAGLSAMGFTSAMVTDAVVGAVTAIVVGGVAGISAGRLLRKAVANTQPRRLQAKKRPDLGREKRDSCVFGSWLTEGQTLSV